MGLLLFVMAAVGMITAMLLMLFWIVNSLGERLEYCIDNLRPDLKPSETITPYDISMTPIKAALQRLFSYGAAGPE